MHLIKHPIKQVDYLHKGYTTGMFIVNKVTSPSTSDDQQKVKSYTIATSGEHNMSTLQTSPTHSLFSLSIK